MCGFARAALDAVRAARVAREDMLNAIYGHVVAEHLAEHVPLRAADARARTCRVADRAMPLDQQVAVGALTDCFGHVTLVGAQARQCTDTRPDGCIGNRDAASIGVDLRRGAGVDDAAQAVLTDRCPNRVDDLHRELGVVVGEQRARRVGDGPRGGRSPACGGGPGSGRHERIGLERGEVLAHRDLGEPQRVGELAHRGGLPSLELVEQPALGGADRGGGHAMSIRGLNGFPKART